MRNKILKDERFKLDKTEFEENIEVGMLKKEIIAYYSINYTPQEIDEWCLENYGADLDCIYVTLHQRSLKQFKSALQRLKENGNNTAMNLLGNFVYDMKESGDGVQKVQIVGGVDDE